MARTRTAVAEALADLDPACPVLVACSGGADSVALAAAAAFVRRRGRGVVGAVTVDHGWHDGSARVARDVVELCRGLGLDPCLAVPLDPADDDGTGGPEARARAGRYAALHRVAAGTGAGAVLLGHTLDDQAETVLLGLLRGSGARSLAGMPARRGLLRRPLLGLRRATTRQACHDQGLAVWHDPANDDPRYARVRARRLVADLIGHLGDTAVPALARTAQRLAEDAEVLEPLALDLLRRARAAGGAAGPAGGTGGPSEVGPSEVGQSGAVPRVGGVLRLGVDELAAAPRALRGRALLFALREAGAPAAATGSRHVEAVAALVERWHGQGPVQVPGGVQVRRTRGVLEIGPGPATGL